MPRSARPSVARLIRAGFALRITKGTQKPQRHNCGRTFAGAGHRREHGHLQHLELTAAYSSSNPRPGASGPPANLEANITRFQLISSVSTAPRKPRQKAV